MEINESGHSLPNKTGRLVLPARCALTHRLREAIPPVLPAQSSRSSRCPDSMAHPSLDKTRSRDGWLRTRGSGGAARLKKFGLVM